MGSSNAKQLTYQSAYDQIKAQYRLPNFKQKTEISAFSVEYDGIGHAVLVHNYKTIIAWKNGYKCIPYDESVTTKFLKTIALPYDLVTDIIDYPHIISLYDLLGNVVEYKVGNKRTMFMTDYPNK